MSSRRRWRSTRPISPVINSSGPGRGEVRGRRCRGSIPLALLGLCVLALVLAACRRPGDAPQVVKIAVIAPFEGLGRRLGYAILPAVEDEIAAANLKRPDSPYRVALVALNDDLDSREAAAQAAAIVQDPAILAVIGPWSEGAAAQTVPILDGAGIPAIAGATEPDSGSEWAFVCPGRDEVASELLRRAGESAVGPIALAGPDNALRRALLARNPGLLRVSESSASPCGSDGGSDCSIVFSGDAVQAAEALRRWRVAGWRGAFVGGPEIARPWLIEQSGASAEGVQAVVCSGPPPPSLDQDLSLAAATQSAAAATRTILAGLESEFASGKSPSRQALLDWLASHNHPPGLAALEVRAGRWASLRG
jgi:ABC-type branched-subunit amino acid transport system substrate-binding protein